MILSAKVGIAFAALLFLAGCDYLHLGGNEGTTANSWIKVNAQPGETASAYRDCQETASLATRKDADIDQDIAATRGADLQRSMVVQARTAQMADKTRRSSDSIIASCMRQKGFVERR